MFLRGDGKTTHIINTCEATNSWFFLFPVPLITKEEGGKVEIAQTGYVALHQQWQNTCKEKPKLIFHQYENV